MDSPIASGRPIAAPSRPIAAPSRLWLTITRAGRVWAEWALRFSYSSVLLDYAISFNAGFEPMDGVQKALFALLMLYVAMKRVARPGFCVVSLLAMSPSRSVLGECSR